MSIYNAYPDASRSHYINYKGLKKLIKKSDAGASPGRGSSDATAFFYELDRSLEDIDAFYNKRSGEIMRRLRLLEGRYQVGPVADLVRLDLPSEEWEELVSAMLDLRASLQKLLVRNDRLLIVLSNSRR